jgi:hypothetical protein
VAANWLPLFLVMCSQNDHGGRSLSCYSIDCSCCVRRPLSPIFFFYITFSYLAFWKWRASGIVYSTRWRNTLSSPRRKNKKKLFLFSKKSLKVFIRCHRQLWGNLVDHPCLSFFSMAEWQQTFDYHLGRHTLSPCWRCPSDASSNVSDVNDTASRMDEFYSLIDRGGLWKNSFVSELYISRCVRCWLMLDTHGTHVQVSHYFIYMASFLSFLYRAPQTKRGKRSRQHPDQRWSSTPLTTSIISQLPCMLSYFKFMYSRYAGKKANDYYFLSFKNLWLKK